MNTAVNSLPETVDKGLSSEALKVLLATGLAPHWWPTIDPGRFHNPDIFVAALEEFSFRVRSICGMWISDVDPDSDDSLGVGRTLYSLAMEAQHLCDLWNRFILDNDEASASPDDDEASEDEEKDEDGDYADPHAEFLATQDERVTIPILQGLRVIAAALSKDRAAQLDVIMKGVGDRRTHADVAGVQS